MAYEVHQHWQKVGELLQAEIPFVSVTLVGMRGSAPQIQGAKAIVTRSGITAGTVGGGKVEARAIEHAQALLNSDATKACELVTWNLQTDIRMTCGGEVQFFFEVHGSADWKICLFGAGHIAQALVPILLQMNCRVSWIDQRQPWLDKIEDHPKLRKICEAEPAEVVQGLDSRSFFVLMTQGHATDLPILAKVLETRSAPYVGVLGSLQKAKVLRRDLKEKGLSEEKIESFYCPMGLPLGNNTPPEIAISIVAQLIERRDALQTIHHKTKQF